MRPYTINEIAVLLNRTDKELITLLNSKGYSVIDGATILDHLQLHIVFEQFDYDYDSSDLYKPHEKLEVFHVKAESLNDETHTSDNDLVQGFGDNTDGLEAAHPTEIARHSLPITSNPEVKKSWMGRLLRRDLRNERLYFNAEHLPASVEKYVLWLDVMGSAATMNRSLIQSANSISKLHIAVLLSRHQKLYTAPFMDGVFVLANWRDEMEDFLCDVMGHLSLDFIKSRSHEHRFLTRSGLSFGRIMFGENISTKVNLVLGARSNTEYRKNIFYGYPLIYANEAEKVAPPFGISLHESTRSFSPNNETAFSGLWFKWHKKKPPTHLDEFVGVLFKYFDWCSSHSNALGYSKDRIRVHRELCTEYFE